MMLEIALEKLHGLRDSYMCSCAHTGCRMNNEVEKSRAKSEKMHQILGAERVSSWCKEHAAEVLTQQQQDLVEGTSKP